MYTSAIDRVYTVARATDSAVENRQLEREDDDNTYANCIDIILLNFIYSRKL